MGSVYANGPTLPVKIYEDPKEGPRSTTITIVPTGTDRTFNVTVPQWTTTSQNGLSQICSLVVDTRSMAPFSAFAFGTIFFPDNNFQIEIEPGAYTIFPVSSGALTFTIVFSVTMAIGAPIVITIQNFYEAPFRAAPLQLVAYDTASLDQPVNVTKIGGISTRIAASNGRMPVNLEQINGTGITAVGGRMSVDIGNQSASPLVVGFGGVNQPVDIKAQTLANLNVNLNAQSLAAVIEKQANFNGVVTGSVLLPAAGITTQRYLTGAGVVRNVELNFDVVINGGAVSGALFGFSIDGAAPIYTRYHYYNAGEVVLRPELIALTDVAIAFAASVDVYCNIFLGGITAGLTRFNGNIGF